MLHLGMLARGTMSDSGTDMQREEQPDRHGDTQSPIHRGEPLEASPTPPPVRHHAGPSEAHDGEWPEAHASELPIVLSSQTIYAGRVVSLQVDEIALSEGRTAVREIVKHPGAVVIAALDEQQRVVLVRQYRHPVGGWLLELPAGGLEPGEDPLAAARRELREEVGLEARSWRWLGEFFSSPGFANERLHAYLAEGLVPVAAAPDDDEDLVVVRYPLGELLAHPEWTPDAKTLATLLLVAKSRGTLEQAAS